jgi:hypothetical protein
MTRRFASPQAFKQSLEARLMAEARKTGEDIGRLRQLVVFDRFMARVEKVLPGNVLLKGGVALELRLAAARATKDIDLSVTGSPRRVPSILMDGVQSFCDDGFLFRLEASKKKPEISVEMTRYGGHRFVASARLAGALYGSQFGVDVVYGHDLSGASELLHFRDLLGPLGIPPAVVTTTNRETHIAEKLHAYTMPRPGPNSRTKDLPDIALLAMTGPIGSGPLMAAIRTVFAVRATNPVPPFLPTPSEDWEAVYARIALKNRLKWRTLSDVTVAAAEFINPPLAGVDGVWDSTAWRWQPASPLATPDTPEE